MHPFVRYWLPVVVYCTAIFVQSSFPTIDDLQDIPFSDKSLHVFAYGILGALLCRAFNSHHRWRHRWRSLVLAGIIAATAYGFSDELHQSFVPGRSAEFADFMADFVGAAVGSLIYVWLIYLRFKADSV